jgi:hypothetical protein
VRAIRIRQKAMCLYLQVQALNCMVVEVHIVLVGCLLLAYLVVEQVLGDKISRLNLVLK